MSIFEYRSRNKKSEIVKGLVDATSEEAVASLLLEKGLSIISIDKKDAKSVTGAFNFILGRVGTKDLVIFFRQMAVMIDANMPIVKALRILIRQTKNTKLKLAVAGLADEVEGGNSLSSAMELFPNIFSVFYINIIKSGETSGRLSNVMEYLADQKEKDYDLESSIKGEMIYPFFIVGALAIVGFIIMTFVMPKMTAMIVESGSDLPLPTRIMIGLSSLLSNYSFIIIPLLLGSIFGMITYSKTKNGKKIKDKLQISVPIFGKIFKYIYIVRICRSLSTLLRGGVPIASGLIVVKDVVDNSIYSAIIAKAINEVAEGNSISEAFSDSKEIPIMVSQMMNVGEETGRLEEILDKISEFYTKEINGLVRNLSKMIEPIIMMVLGVGVGFFIAAIILPIWQLSSME